jgi:hypothetical protein
MLVKMALKRVPKSARPAQAAVVAPLAQPPETIGKMKSDSLLMLIGLPENRAPGTDWPLP